MNFYIYIYVLIIFSNFFNSINITGYVPVAHVFSYLSKPKIKILYDAHAKAKEQLREIRNAHIYDYNIQPIAYSNHQIQFHEYSKSERNILNNVSPNDWKVYFEYLALKKGLSLEINDWHSKQREVLFSLFCLYQFEGYRKFLHLFPECGKTMQNILDRYNTDKQFAQDIDNLPENNNISVLDFIYEEACSYRNYECAQAFEDTKDILVKKYKNKIENQLKPENINFNNSNINNNKFEKSYSMDISTQELLKVSNINKEIFEKCYGDIIQQELHQEFLQINSNITELYNKNSNQDLKDFCKGIINFSSIGCNANKLDLQEPADYCATLCKYMLAFGNGVVNSFSNNAEFIGNLIRHPLNTTGEIYKAAEQMVTCAAKTIFYLAKYAGFAELSLSELNSIQEYIKDDFIELDKVINNISNKFTNLKGEDYLEAIGYFVTDSVLFIYGPKLIKPEIKKAKYLFGSASKEISQLIGIGITKGIDKFKTGVELIENNPYFLATQKSLSKALDKAIICSESYNSYIDELSESIKLISQKAKIQGIEYARIFKDLKLPYYYIPPYLPVPSNNFGGIKRFLDKFGNEWIYNPAIIGGFEVKLSELGQDILNWRANSPNILLMSGQQVANALGISTNHINYFIEFDKEITELAKKFADIKHTITDRLGLDLIINMEHILGIDLKMLKSGIYKLSGLHHDLNNFLEKIGIIDLKNKVIDINGCYKADIWINGKLIKYGKTFFPSNWSREKVIKKIIEASNNIIEKEIEFNGTIKIKGLTREGIKIISIIENCGKISTSYPILE